MVSVASKKDKATTDTTGQQQSNKMDTLMTVIPAIDVMGGNVVRLYRGDPKKMTVYGRDPVAVAKRWEACGAHMLHVVDLDATLGLGSNSKIVRSVADAVSIPVQVAGGLRSVPDALAAAKTANRIVVGTLAFTDAESLRHITDELGSDRVVVSADYDGSSGNVMIRGWQDSAGVAMLDAIREMHDGLGITEFLITNVGLDGTLQGPDTSYLGQACQISDDIHIIASGGISAAHDIPMVYDAGAWGVILGRALYDQKISIPEALDAVSRMAKEADRNDAYNKRREKGGVPV